MLKKSASGVLASLRDSTYRSVRLASSLAAALLDGLEHPASGKRERKALCMTVETDLVAGGTGGKKCSRWSKLSRCTIEQNVLDTLVYRGIINQADVLAAVDDSKDGSVDLETVLLDRYHVPKDALGSALSDYYQCSYLPYDER